MTGRAKAFPARRSSFDSLPVVPVAGGEVFRRIFVVSLLFYGKEPVRGLAGRGMERKALSCRMAAVCGKPRHAARGLLPQCERVLPDPLTQAACFPAVAGKQV